MSHLAIIPVCGPLTSVGIGRTQLDAAQNAFAACSASHGHEVAVSLVTNGVQVAPLSQAGGKGNGAVDLEHGVRVAVYTGPVKLADGTEDEDTPRGSPFYKAGQWDESEFVIELPGVVGYRLGSDQDVFEATRRLAFILGVLNEDPDVVPLVDGAAWTMQRVDAYEGRKFGLFLGEELVATTSFRSMADKFVETANRIHGYAENGMKP